MKRGIIFMTSLFIMFSVVSFGKKLATLPGLAKPYSLVMDDTQFYVCDGVEVSIYSLKDFQLKTKFGKRGEGPQEFRAAAGGSPALILFPQKDHLLINSLGKVSYYSKEGKFIKETKIEGSIVNGMFQPIGDKFAGLAMTMGKNMSMEFTINLFDSEFKKTKEIYKQKFMQQGSMSFPMVFPAFFVKDNKIIAPGGEEFVINILDAEGNKVNAITREYKRLKVDEDYKKGVHDFFKSTIREQYEFIKQMITFTDYFPAIQFFFAEDGKIYIQTYLREEKEDKYELFIYDLEGKFLKRLFIPVKYVNGFQPTAYTIKNNTFFQLIENEDEEEWELHAIEIK